MRSFVRATTAAGIVTATIMFGGPLGPTAVAATASEGTHDARNVVGTMQLVFTDGSSFYSPSDPYLVGSQHAYFY